MIERSPEYEGKALNAPGSPQCLPFSHPNYRPPTSDEVREALRKANFTGSQAGQYLGVHARTIRKWVGGEREIPYAAWRLLLFYIGIVSAQDLKKFQFPKSDSDVLAS